MSLRKPTRRAFLGTAALAGAGALTLTDGSKKSGLSWCGRPAFPMAEKTCWFRPPSDWDGPVELRLEVQGPGLEAPEVLSRQMVTASERVGYRFALCYPHETMEAGEWRYMVVASHDGFDLRSDAATYTLRRFQFGV